MLIQRVDSNKGEIVQMADFQTSITIDKPLNEVFAFMVNLENSPDFMPNLIKSEKITDGPISAGTKYLETRYISGRQTVAEVVFTEFNENRSYTVKSETNGLGVVFDYNFQEVDEATRIEFAATIETSGFIMKLTKPLLVKMIKREDGNQLQYLKDILEENKTN
ncbi:MULTISPECIES: SRPBCC family protein [Bacillus]|uniref:SRPBCC family protein n=1 Tax=Bacillus TaxID=1386 RepID=UPI002154F9BE|nr:MULTISPECIES: SRPBCC family protein [Bacillus]